MYISICEKKKSKLKSIFLKQNSSKNKKFSSKISGIVHTLQI